MQERVPELNSVSSTSVGTFGFIPLKQMMGQARPASDLFRCRYDRGRRGHRYPEDLSLDEYTGKVSLDALGLQLSFAPRSTPYSSRSSASGWPVARQRCKCCTRPAARSQSRHRSKWL